MATLRERQRERRYTDIMDAAWGLFGQKGLEETSVEEIAACAQVGPATVYNYFGSKNDLLVALFVRYIEEEADAGEAVLQDLPGDAVDGMMALFETYLEGLASRCSPLLLRQFYALGISRQFDYGRHTYELKRRFFQQGHRLIAHYKHLGQIREDVTDEEATALCYSATMFPMLMFAMDLGIDLEAARCMLRRNLCLTLSGIGSAHGQAL